MRSLNHMIRMGRRIVPPVRWKEFNELNYWKQRKKAEGILSNSHYKHFYTTHFGLEDSYYNNKIILDIGCGPRGSQPCNNTVHTIVEVLDAMPSQSH